MAKKPKVFTVLKILGPCAIAIGIVLIVLGAVVFPEPFGFSGEMTQPNFALLVPGIFIAFAGLPMTIMGFVLEMGKTSIQTARYLQEETKEDLTEMIDTSADIASGAIKKTVSAVKEGLVADVKYCKHCGTKLTVDAKFCSNCGKEQ